MRRELASGLVLMSTLALSAMRAAPVRPSAVVAEQSLQEHLDRVRTFTASFVHDYESGVLKKRYRESGTVAVKKPGRMRWEYLSPEKKTFVCDGQRFYFSVPIDKQVFEGHLPPTNHADVPALLLGGDLRLKDDFAVQWLNGTDWTLRLDPKLPQADFAWLAISVDPSSVEVRSVISIASDGTRSTFTFDRYRENIRLSDDLFKFAIPKNFEVIQRGP